MVALLIYLIAAVVSAFASLTWGMSLVIFAPLVTWLVLVVAEWV